MGLEQLEHIQTYSKNITDRHELPSLMPYTVAEGRVDAAILVPLMALDETWHVILTKRAATLSKHPNEIACPGGKRDPTDASIEATALREAEEEIALPRASVEVVGFLEPGVTRYGTVVHPVIGHVRGTAIPHLRANPAEVAEIFTAPLEMFLSPRSLVTTDHFPLGSTIGIRLYDFAHGHHRITGVTAAILVKTASILFNRPPSFPFDFPFSHLVKNPPNKL